MRDLDWMTPELRIDLVKMVGRRVPQADVEDVVQATLADALARGVGGAVANSAVAANPPQSAQSVVSPAQVAIDPRAYVFGIARHKIADFYRRAKRESFEVPEVTAPPEPHEAESMLRWAQARAGNDNQTLGWLLRESEGDALESIAAEAQLPAPRVRKRVSRLRQHLRDHWRRDLLALAALGLAGVLVALYWHRHQEPPIARDQVLPNVLDERMANDERARRLRESGLEACKAGKFELCLLDLDAARELSPGGDAADDIQSARRQAIEAMRKPAPVAPRPITKDRAGPSAARVGTDEPSPSNVPVAPTAAPATTSRVEPPTQLSTPVGKTVPPLFGATPGGTRGTGTTGNSGVSTAVAPVTKPVPSGSDLSDGPPPPKGGNVSPTK
jgi:hypothetical protein